MPEEFTCIHQLRLQLYDKVKPGKIYFLKYNSADGEEEVARFNHALREKPIDIMCMGIGTSGHLAFNEPFATNFEDREWVRIIDIAEQSKRQLRDDPNFKALGYIPEQGITMTIPALLSARNIFTMVPLALKRPIMIQLFAQAEPTVKLPASILSTVESILYLDKNSCPEGF